MNINKYIKYKSKYLNGGATGLIDDTTDLIDDYTYWTTFKSIHRFEPNTITGINCKIFSSFDVFNIDETPDDLFFKLNEDDKYKVISILKKDFWKTFLKNELNLNNSKSVAFSVNSKTKKNNRHIINTEQIKENIKTERNKGILKKSNGLTLRQRKNKNKGK